MTAIMGSVDNPTLWNKTTSMIARMCNVEMVKGAYFNRFGSHRDKIGKSVIMLSLTTSAHR